MDLEGIPAISKDLLDALDRRYPEACAEPGQPIDELMFYGGKRDLIRWLRLVYEEQNQSPEASDDEA